MCENKINFFFHIYICNFFNVLVYNIVFCGVYKNTQITFIKDTVISFAINLIYPFIFYFISACFRICSLKYKKKNYKCLYSFSYIIPFF